MDRIEQKITGILLDNKIEYYQVDGVEDECVRGLEECAKAIVRYIKERADGKED